MNSYINTNIKFNIDFKSDKIKVLLGIFLGIYVFFLTFCIYKRLYLTEHDTPFKNSNHTDTFKFELNQTKHIDEINLILVNLKKKNNKLLNISGNIKRHYTVSVAGPVKVNIHNHINKILKNIKEILNANLLDDYPISHDSYRGKHIEDKKIDEFYKLLKYNITEVLAADGDGSTPAHREGENTLKNTKYINVKFDIFNMSTGNIYKIYSGFIIFDDDTYNNKIDDYKYIIDVIVPASPPTNVKDKHTEDEIINDNLNWLSQDRYYKHLDKYHMMDLSESQYEDEKTAKNIMLDFDYLDYKCNKRNEYDMRRKIDYEGKRAELEYKRDTEARNRAAEAAAAAKKKKEEDAAAAAAAKEGGGTS